MPIDRAKPRSERHPQNHRAAWLSHKTTKRVTIALAPVFDLPNGPGQQVSTALQISTCQYVAYMKISQRLGRALDRAGKSQREIAERAKMEEGTLSKIINGKTASPFFGTIEKIVRAADLTWGELFDEPQMRLSETDARTAREFREVLTA